MAIIFPDHCRGTTRGALRQIREVGHTSACGGLVDRDSWRAFVGTDDFFGGYFRKDEPAGRYMSDLAQKKEEVEQVTEAILESSRKMVASAVDSNKRLAETTGKLRDGAEKLGAAMDKLLKIAERGDFKETVSLTEQLVSSLERLAVLEQKGVLDKVMSAMAGAK